MYSHLFCRLLSGNGHMSLLDSCYSAIVVESSSGEKLMTIVVEVLWLSYL